MRYLITILLLGLTYFSSAQVVESFGARFTIVTDTLISGSDDFYVRGYLRHPRATFNADSAQVGDIIIDADCNIFTVDSILQTNGQYLRVRITPQDTSINDIRAATGGIIRLNSPPNGTYTFPANVPLELMDCFLNYNFQALSGIDSVYYVSDTLYVVTPGETFAVKIESDPAFDGNRPILRVPETSDVLGTTTVTEWLEWWYFTAPTLSISSMTSPVEVGTSNTYYISGSTTNPGGATLSAGYFRQTSPSTDTLVSFGSGTSYADTILYTPQQGGSGQFNALSYTFQAKQSWVFGSESGTATSTARTIQGVYPVLYGMSATDFSVTGDPYTLTKLVQTEGNKTVTLTGSGYIYYLVPKTWGDYTLSQIIDHNGFNVTPSFTSYDVTVSSSGLVNDWTAQPYKLYKLNTTTTTSGYAYQFIR